MSAGSAAACSLCDTPSVTDRSIKRPHFTRCGVAPWYGYDMHRVTSKDGTWIAYDRHGRGPAVILVWAARSTTDQRTRLWQRSWRLTHGIQLCQTRSGRQWRHEAIQRAARGRGYCGAHCRGGRIRTRERCLVWRNVRLRGCRSRHSHNRLAVYQCRTTRVTMLLCAIASIGVS